MGHESCAAAGQTYVPGAMRPDRMTTKSQEAFRVAHDQAARRGNPELLPEHLLVAMLGQEGGVAHPLVQKAGGDAENIAKLLEKKLETLPRVTGGAEPAPSRRTMDVRRKAEGGGKRPKD